MDRTFVIVGANLAGGAAAGELRERGFEGRVVLIGAEPDPPYDRPPLSKEYLRGEQGFEEVLLEPADSYEEREIEGHFGERVVGLDLPGPTVELEGGERIGADAVLLATGGRNRGLEVPGRHLEGVHDLRTREDADRLRQAAGMASRAVVVGMGFIGCEVAASLRMMGLEVTAVEPREAPLAGPLGPEVGRAVEGLHRDHGVELVLGETVAAFEGDGRVEQVVTGRGHRYPCQVAVVGVGIEPAVELAVEAGLEVEDGILVDEHCRTSAPGVYAAGDVARHLHPLVGERLRVEHWQNARLQGQAAARNMLGIDEPYDEVHWFWSDQYDVTISYAGFHGSWDELVFRGDPEERDFTAFYLAEGRIRAAAGMGRGGGRQVRRAMGLIREGVAVERALLADPEADVGGPGRT